MAKVVNNINMELHESTIHKAKENNNSIPSEKIIDGVFNLSGSPQFSAKVGSQYTKFELGCDEPSVLGGPGVHPTPLTYLLFGVMACFSSSLAAQCAEEGLELKDLKVRGKLLYDLGPAVIESDAPIIKGMKLEVISTSNLDRQIKEAWKKCPAVYAIQNPIPTEINQVKS